MAIIFLFIVHAVLIKKIYNSVN